MMNSDVLLDWIHNSRLRLRNKIAILICALPLFSGLASGQTLESNTIEEKTLTTTSSASSSSAPASSEATEITVVGSRIRRTTFDSPSPIQIITREGSLAAGFNSTTEILQSTAVTNGASQINNAYGGYVTDGGPGANTISLRGLGASRTLVLINGRRLSPAGTRGAIGSADLNVLPDAMIDRVEILRDGASSVYGSEAIGGVVNVITMDKLDGLKVEGSLNAPYEGAGVQSRFSIAGGFSDDRWSVSGSVDFYVRNNLTLSDRDWTKCSTDGLRDPETGESLDDIDPLTGKPKCSTISGTGTSGVTINTIGTQSINPSNYAALGLSSAPVGGPGTFGSSFTRFRPNAAITTGVIGFEGVGGGGNSLNARDTFDPQMLEENLISPAKIVTSFVQGNYDLQALGDAKLYFELLAHRRTSEQASFRQLSLDYRRGSALIPAELAFGNFGPDQGTSDGDRVGVRAFIGFGLDSNEQTVNYTKPTFGIKGDVSFLPDWKYDAYASYARNDASYLVKSFLLDKVTYASDAVVAPVGTDTALVRNGLTCRVNLTDPDERCILYPKLNAATIGGDLPADFRDYIFRDVVGNTLYEESEFSAIVDGPLLTLPAGKLQAVLGVEHRRAKIDDEPDQNSIDGNLYNLSSAAVTKGKDNVTELFTEIEIPILADAPGAKELTANGSYRYTDYESYGSDTTYKVGFVYSPSAYLSFRGTRGTSFRAPALFEQFQGATSGFLSGNGDPCNEYGVSDNPNLVANCDSELHDPEFLATNGIETFNVGGAAAGLKAETSVNTTYGVIIQPDIGSDRELSLAVDYFNIEIDNGVAQVGAAGILGACYQTPGFRAAGGLCNLVTRDPDTKQLTVSDAYTNISTAKTRGVDFTGRYEQELGAGQLVIDLTTTHYLSQTNQIFETDDSIDANGTILYPEWSGTSTVSYFWNEWRFTYGIDWVGSMDSYKLAEEDPATSELDLKVPNYYEHRMSVRYKTDTWEATFGVRNLTNKEPPTISALVYDRVGNAPLYSGYDYIGREFFLNVQKQF